MDIYPVIKQFARTLRNLDAVLDKAIKHAEARKFDVNNFCAARLFPDMLPFVVPDPHRLRQRQVGRREPVGQGGPQARGHRDDDAGAARPHREVPGLPRHLHRRRLRADQARHAWSGCRTDPARRSRAEEYLYARQIPNFFFHVTTAYDLLRHGGVEIGKSDYLGTLGFVDV